jgi:hypothetical protein
MVVILGVSVLPLPLKEWLHTGGLLHPAFHFAAFFVAVVLLTLGSSNWQDRLMRGSVALLFAICTEYLEAGLYHNTMEWNDVLTDACGIAAGLAIAFFWRNRMQQAIDP